MLFPLALFALGLGVEPHPGSLSRTLVTVNDDAIAVELRTQLLTWHETLSIDADGDDVLTLAELEGKRTELALYLDDRLDMLVPEGDDWHATPMQVGRFELLDASDEFPDRYDWVRVELVYDLGHDADGSLAELTVESRLFLESNPDHLDYCSVEWVGEAPSDAVFGDGLHRATFQPQGARRAGVFAGFVELGIDHILSGWDHLAFVLALIVAARRVRSLVGVVTAFTAAHSITLALAALDVFALPARFVELAIALSIAYVAIDNLLRREAHAAWLEAFGFGLIHGLGFAGFLSDALAGEPLVVTALVGFNLGVEAGQLAVVALVAVVLLAMRRLARRADDAEDEEPDWLAPRWLRVVLNVAIALAGLFWFGQRAGWIG